MPKPEHLLAEHHLERRVTHQLRCEEEKVVLDQPCPQDGAICHPLSCLAMDSTREMSKRKTKRCLVRDSRKEDVGDQSQLGRAKEESKRQAAVAVSGHGLICPRAQRD